MWMIACAFYIYMNRQRSLFYGNLIRQYEADIARYPLPGDEIEPLERQHEADIARYPLTGDEIEPLERQQ